MRHVKQFEINGKKVRQSACIALNGAPNAATEGRVGSLAIDTSSAYHEVYKCVAVNGAIHTWELLASGDSGGNGTSTGSGKSAYEYAKDGGYTGTEGQFAMLLANAVDKRNITIGLHTDGRIYLFINGETVGNGVAFPSGESGDVVGNVDSGNNIILTGDLADGTYTIKYQMADGSTIDIGELVRGSSSGGNSGGNTGGDTGSDSGETTQPTNPDNILTNGAYTIERDKRWSNTSNAFTGCTGMIALAVPLADVLNKTIYMKGFVNGQKASDKGATWYIYNGNTRVGQLYGNSSIVWNAPTLTDEGNGVYSIPVNTDTFDNVDGDTLYINLAVKASASVSVADLSSYVITIDKPIS